MTLSIKSPTPVTRHDFQAAEIWLLLQALGAVDSGLEIPAEVAANQAEVDTARASLIQQGILLVDSTGEVSVAPEIEALVRPSAFPETVFIANITDNAKFGKLARVMCFGWTPETTTVNWVDEANTHHFEAYASVDIKEVVLSHLWGICNLDVDDPDPNLALSPAEVEREMEQMRQSVLLMAIQGVQSAEQTTRAIAWFVSGRRVWLMRNASREPSEQPSPVVASQAEIELAISELVEQALLETAQRQ